MLISLVVCDVDTTRGPPRWAMKRLKHAKREEDEVGVGGAIDDGAVEPEAESLNVCSEALGEYAVGGSAGRETFSAEREGGGGSAGAVRMGADTLAVIRCVCRLGGLASTGSDEVLSIRESRGGFGEVGEDK